MWLELLSVGVNALRAHKFRAALTVLSITIGAFSIVLMASLAASGIATLSRGIEEVGGARMVALFPRSAQKGERKLASYHRGLTRQDGEALRGRVPHLRYLEAFADLGSREVRVGGSETKRADLVAATPDFLGAFTMTLAAGRPVDSDDVAGHRRVALIGHGVATALFSSAEEALGKILRVGTETFRVVGVVAKVKRFGVRFGFDWNDFVMVPLTAIENTDPQVGLLLISEGKSHNDIIKRIAGAVISARHKGIDDFEAFDFSVIVEKFYSVFRIMQIIVAFIAAVALMVGGIGVMNILLVSVSERVREIGIRKAMGAGDRAIALQFLIESALLSGIGGLCGTLGGVAGALIAGLVIARKEQAWVGRVSPEAVVGALLSSIVIGLVFGIMPARRAARLQVVECLRSSG
jgi:putative ABC transport system permease protein